jgi:glycosyltransferase involved in cell wall biosynthesis
VIENYVKLSEFSVTNAKKENAVCYIGILHHTRGVIPMVDATAIAGSTLYLAGHYYSDTLHQEATQRGGWSNVKELGFIDRVQMQDIFSRCIAGLVILAPRLNYNHSSCNKLFEYMSAGLPVIASDLPFARAVIEKHQCGLLVSPAMDVDAIAKAIEWLASHPEEAHEMGRRGRQAVEAEYAWEHEEIKLFDLYREVWGG